MINKIAEVIKSHIKGHTEEDERERKHFVLDGFEEAASEIVEETLDILLSEPFCEDEYQDEFIKDKIRRRLKGG